MKFAKKEIIKNLFKAKNIYFNSKKPLKGGSGVMQPIYADHRMLLSFIKERTVIFQALAELIKEEIGLANIDIIAGNETAGIAVASFVAQTLNLPMVYIRKQPKKSGTKSQIEGLLNKNSRVLIVDDMIVTGGNISRAAEVIRRQGAKVRDCIVISSIESPEAKKNFKRSAIKRHFLVSFQDIVNEGLKMGYFSSQDKKIIDNFLNDPISWFKIKHLT